MRSSEKYGLIKSYFFIPGSGIQTKKMNCLKIHIIYGIINHIIYLSRSMKNKTIYVSASIIVLVGVGIFSAIKFIPRVVQEDTVDTSDYVVAHTQIGNLPLQTLSNDEKIGLITMREEEKLAHDVYIALYDKWKLNVFRNIASSESTHTEAVRYLLERYKIEDPVKSQAVGVFTSSDFSKLYTDLVKKGQNSLKDALVVGATIEDLDIRDLKDLIGKTDNQDIQAVYNNLMRGSRNHLRSFSKQLSRNGAIYTAQYLSQVEVNQIISSNQEKGW